MSRNFAPVQTDVGYAAMLNSQNAGQNWKIVAISIGDGAGTGYVPTAAQTELKNEKMRSAIIDSEVLSDGFRVVAQFQYDALVGEFENREVGFWMQVADEEPVLWAVYSEADLTIDLMNEGNNYIPAYNVVITRGDASHLVLVPTENSTQPFNLNIICGLALAQIKNSLTILKQIGAK